MSTTRHELQERHSVLSLSRMTTTLLLWAATVLLILGIFAVWADRLLLNADNWAATSGQLLRNPVVRTAVAKYLVDELYANVDVSSLVQSGLPGVLKPAAPAVSGGIRLALVDGTEQALRRPVVRRAWKAANHAAATTLISVVNGSGPTATVNGGEVTLNLRAVLNQVAGRVGLGSDLGSRLPASAAHLTIMRSDQIKLVQFAGRTLSGLALVLSIVVPLLYLFIFLTARGSRARTLRRIGIYALVAGLVVIGLRALMVTEIPRSLVTNAASRPAAQAAVSIATSTLVELAGAVILIAAVMVAGGLLGGRSRVAQRLRAVLAPGFRDHPLVMYVAAAVLLAALFVWHPIAATGQPIGMLVCTVLALLGVEALRRQSVAELGRSATMRHHGRDLRRRW